MWPEANDSLPDVLRRTENAVHSLSNRHTELRHFLANELHGSYSPSRGESGAGTGANASEDDRYDSLCKGLRGVRELLSRASALGSSVNHEQKLLSELQELRTARERSLKSTVAWRDHVTAQSHEFKANVSSVLDQGEQLDSSFSALSEVAKGMKRDASENVVQVSAKYDSLPTRKLMHDTISSLEKKRKAIQSRVDALATKERSLTGTVHELETKTKSETEKHEKECEQHRVHWKKLRDDLSKAEESSAQYVEKAEQEKAQLERLAKERWELQQQREVLHGEVEACQEAVDAARDEHKIIQEEMRRVRAVIMDDTNKSRATKEAHDALHEAFDKLQQQVQELDAKKATLLKEIADLQQQKPARKASGPSSEAPRFRRMMIEMSTDESDNSVGEDDDSSSRAKNPNPQGDAASIPAARSRLAPPAIVKSADIGKSGMLGVDSQDAPMGGGPGRGRRKSVVDTFGTSTSLEATVKTLREEQGRLHTNLTELRRKCATKSNELVELTRIIAESQLQMEQLKDIDAKIADGEAQISALMQKRRGLESECTFLESQKEQLTTSLEKQQQMTARNDGGNEAVDDLRVENETLRAAVVSYENDIHAFVAAVRDPLGVSNAFAPGDVSLAYLASLIHGLAKRGGAADTPDAAGTNATQIVSLPADDSAPASHQTLAHATNMEPVTSAAEVSKGHVTARHPREELAEPSDSDSHEAARESDRVDTLASGGDNGASRELQPSAVEGVTQSSFECLQERDMLSSPAELADHSEPDAEGPPDETSEGVRSESGVSPVGESDIRDADVKNASVASRRDSVEHGITYEVISDKQEDFAGPDHSRVDHPETLQSEVSDVAVHDGGDATESAEESESAGQQRAEHEQKHDARGAADEPTLPLEASSATDNERLPLVDGPEDDESADCGEGVGGCADEVDGVVHTTAPMESREENASSVDDTNTVVHASVADGDAGNDGDDIGTSTTTEPNAVASTSTGNSDCVVQGRTDETEQVPVPEAELEDEKKRTSIFRPRGVSVILDAVGVVNELEEDQFHDDVPEWSDDDDAAPPPSAPPAPTDKPQAGKRKPPPLPNRPSQPEPPVPQAPPAAPSPAEPKEEESVPKAVSAPVDPPSAPPPPTLPVAAPHADAVADRPAAPPAAGSGRNALLASIRSFDAGQSLRKTAGPPEPQGASPGSEEQISDAMTAIFGSGKSSRNDLLANIRGFNKGALKHQEAPDTSRIAKMQSKAPVVVHGGQARVSDIAAMAAEKSARRNV